MIDAARGEDVQNEKSPKAKIIYSPQLGIIDPINFKRFFVYFLRMFNEVQQN